MSFKVTSFSTIRITVSDVQTSRDWYSAFFNQEPFFEIENFVSFNIAGTIFDITLADNKSPLSTGGNVGYWLVDDLEGLIAQAHKLGGKVWRGPLRVEEINRTILQIQDPYGNVLGFEVPF